MTSSLRTVRAWANRTYSQIAGSSLIAASLMLVGGCSLKPKLAIPILVSATANPLPTKFRYMLERKIVEEMSAHSIPAIMVSVVAGKAGYAGAFGFARLGSKAVVATPETSAPIGSLTKSFIGAAILDLARAGKLDIHSSVSKYFPNYRLGASVTVEDLLNQTSGIPNYLNDSRVRLALISGKPIDTIAIIQSLKPAFIRATRWQYSNSNYALLSAIVTKTSGTSDEQFLAQHVLSRCGLRSTRLSTDTVPGIAWGYSIVAKQTVRQIPIPPAMLGGAAGAVSSATDLTKWQICSWRKGLYSNIRPVDRNLGRLPSGNGYLAGWFVDRSSSGKLFWHNGFLPGYSAAMATLPLQDVAVTVLSNSDTFDPTELTVTLVRRLARDGIAKMSISRNQT